MSQNQGKSIKSAGWLLNLISFIAVICVGVSLILTKVGLNGKVTGVLSDIAQIISYVILVIVSCFYVVKRRNVWLWITWAVSVVLIVISFIL